MAFGLDDLMTFWMTGAIVYAEDVLLILSSLCVFHR